MEEKIARNKRTITGLGIASLVSGILTFFGFIAFFGFIHFGFLTFVFGISAIFFGVTAWIRNRDALGLAGLILGIIGIVSYLMVVGILVMYLSGITPTPQTPTAALTFQGQYYPSYGNYNQTCIQIIHLGGDTISEQDIYCTFRAKVGGRDNVGANNVRGNISDFGTGAAPTITWTSGSDSNVSIPYSPGNLTPGSTWELVFNNSNGTVVDVMEFSIVHEPSGMLMYQDLDVPAPEPLS